MAGQNADMTLKVGLDLNFFKQELQKASSSLAGQPIDINIRFNKQGIADQYRLLTRYLGGKKSFDVKIESNTLNALTNKVANFQKTLQALKDEKVELSINASANIEKFSKEKIRKIRAQIRSDIVSGGAGEIQLPTKLAAPSTSAFIKDVAKKVKEQTSASYAEGGIPIATKLKVPGITDLLKALQKNLNRNPISIATSFKESGKSEAALAKIIRNAEKNKAVLGTELAPLGADEIAEFRKTVESKLSGIKVTVDATLGKGFAAGQTGLAGLEEYMRTQGLSGGPRGAVETGRRAQFESLIESASSAELKRYMKTAEIAGRSALTTKAQMQEALLKINDVAMENILGNMKMQMRDPLPIKKSFLDQVARAVFWMAGVDPAYLKQQAAQRRALPSIDFPGTVPARNISIGPSTTGRALPAGASAAGLIGAAQAPAGLLPSATRQSGLTAGLEALIQSLTSQSRGRRPEGPSAIVSMETGFIPAMRERFAKAAERYLFGVETQVMDLFDAALRQVESAVDLHIAKIQGQISQRMRSAFSVVDLGVQGRPMLPGAATGQAPLMLPSAGGTTPRGQMRFNAVRTGEFVPPTPLMLPPAGGTTPVGQMRFNAVRTGAQPLTGQSTPFASPISPSYLAQRDLIKSLRGSEQFLNKAKIPFSGAIRELGEEFGFALKQVLLFGTAYKALAFFTDLPAQALRASTDLQTFNNQLLAITGSANNAARAFDFVTNVATRFNVPLDSAREGFVRLYASMAPAGFSSEQIENLFTGITKASATLGLSADKVDRVTYAFAQMASKGQLMSEEVSGQLGDVIPGALSIMAEAARMDIATFKKAMEDGAFVGKAFEQVMANVPIVLENRFGKGAVGAAKTLQGAMNALSTASKQFYESFAPIIDIGASQVFPIIASAIEQATSAVKALSATMQGNGGPANMLSANARAIYDAFLQVKEIAGAAFEVLKNLAPTFVSLAKGILEAFNQAARFINTPLGSFIANVVIQAALLTSGLQLLAKLGVGQAIAGMVNLVFNTKQAITQLKLLITTSKMAQLGLISLGAAVVITSLMTLVEGLNRVYQKMLDIQSAAKNAAQAIGAMSQTEATVKAREIEGQIAILQRFYSQASKFKDLPTEASAAEVTAMAAAGGTPGQAFTGPLVDQKTGKYGRGTITPVMVPAAIQALQQQLSLARKQAQPITVQQAQLGDVDISAGGDGKKEKGKIGLDRLVSARFAQLGARLKAEMELAREETAAIAPDTTQAERMLKYYSQFRQQLIDMAIIQAQIEDAEKNRASYLADGMSASELEYNLQQLRNELQVRGLDLLATEQKYRNEAAKDAAKEAEESRKEQEKFVSTLLDIKNENGFISTQEYNRLKIDEQIRKILEEFPSLTEQQKKEVESIIRNKQTQLKVVKEEIELLRAVNDVERRRIKLQREGYTKEKIKEIIDLEKVRDNIQATREIIDNFVTDTSSDYKGFLKEVISGEDAVDALKKFQEGLKDRVLTIFLDFTMAPVEKFFKEVAGGNLLKALFPESAEEKAAAAQANNTTALGTVKTAIELATNAIKNLTLAIGGDIGVPSTKNMANLGASNVGNDLASQLMNERGYEDIAGLLPLPLEKMRQQAARPLRMVWQQIQGAMEGVYGMAEKEVKKTFKPNPAIHQKVLQGIQRVESFRTGPNTWDPGEAQWKERENRWREDKRSKPSSMPLQSFMTTATQMRDSLSEVVRKAGGLAVPSGTRLGSQLDFSDYLSEQQKKILATGVKEVLNSAMNASFQELRGSAQSNRDPSRMPSFEKATSQMQGLLPSFRAVIQEALSQEAAKGQRYAMDAMKKFGMPAPVDPSFYRSLEYLDPSRGQERLRELSPLNEPPLIIPGIQDHLEGASLPFNMQKMSTSYGQVATIGGLNGLVDGGNFLEMAGVNLESFASNVETFKAGTENLNSSMEGVVNSTYATAQQMSPEGNAGNQFMKALGATVQGIGIAAGSIMGIMAGINQVKEGGASNVLGGIGMIASAAGSLLGGISSLGGMFKGGGGANMGGSNYFDPLSGKGVAGPNFGLAKGGIMHGGFTPFRAFANGGIVTGPTMGLVGEGRYSEAVVPLPDGKSIPVKMNGGQSSRELLSNNGMNRASSPILSMSFQSTTINGVEYVDRAQLEAAMAETRRLAAREGASQGSQLALNKLKNSPTTRRQLGF